MVNNDRMKLVFPSSSENVGVARVAAAAFATRADLTLSDLEEIKVAISEAVSNAVIHGYKDTVGEIEVILSLTDGVLEFEVRDEGRGIADIALARQPSYSSDPERMGLGFVFMESFMDALTVESEVGRGTRIRMVKRVAPGQEH